MNKFFIYILFFFTYSIVNANEINQPKNVLFIMVDDLRPELFVYNQDHIKSPNIDTLAARGVTFNRAYCNVPVCGASRASILSGVRPTQDRFLTYYSSINEAGPQTEHMVDYFNKRGYTTISNNKITHLKNDIKSWDEEWYPTDISWRNYQDPKNRELDKEKKPAAAYEMLDVDDNVYFDGLTAQKSIKDLKKLQNSNSPFFLAVGFVKPHLPFTAPKKYWDLYKESDIKLPIQNIFPESAPNLANHQWGELRRYRDIPKKGPIDHEMSKKLIHAYYASVSYVDAQIGKLLNALDDFGLRDNTIVVLVGDHGWSLLEHGLWAKHSNFEVALHVPMIISAPNFPVNVKTNSIAELVDIYPTLCELTTGPKPKHLQGTSLVYSMINPEKLLKTTALARWKRGETLIYNDFFYTEWKLQSGRISRMLYDHSNDPDETKNLAILESYSDMVESLSQQLKRFKETFN